MDTLGCYMLQLGRRSARDTGGFLAFVLCLGWVPLAVTQQAPRPQGVANCAIHDETGSATDAALAQGETVMLDAWFNSQQRLNASGQKEYFHYKWDDDTNTGYSCLGSIFIGFGAKLDTLYSAPTLEKLKSAQYYIIASPDIPSKNPHPNYVQPEDAEQVAEWVKQGGVLLLMENDPANADIDHLDLVADRFGIHFNDVLSHHVVGDDFPSGTIAVKGGGPIFHDPHTIYMKDTCTISVKPPARALLEDKGDTMIAAAKYGKGTVVAVVDPWLYNEYTDNRKKLPVQDNYAAGKEFVRWLIKQRQGETGSAASP
jgi:unsaturated rhamnogalacturonyl hydrolase